MFWLGLLTGTFLGSILIHVLKDIDEYNRKDSPDELFEEDCEDEADDTL